MAYLTGLCAVILLKYDGNDFGGKTVARPDTCQFVGVDLSTKKPPLMSSSLMSGLLFKEETHLIWSCSLQPCYLGDPCLPKEERILKINTQEPWKPLWSLRQWFVY